MKHTIKSLIIGAERKFNITATVTENNVLSYADTYPDNVSTFHYKDAQSLIIGLVSLYDTGHASLPAQS